MTGQRLNTGLQELKEDECLELLATQAYGRLGIVADGRPAIFPVNYSLDDDRCVIFRTVAGMKLAGAINHHVVFEVDRVDPDRHTGWSVVVHGVAHQTDRVLPSARPLASWLPDRPYLLRITRNRVTGRYVGALLGSVGAGCIRHATRPVVVIPQGMLAAENDPHTGRPEAAEPAWR